MIRANKGKTRVKGDKLELKLDFMAMVDVLFENNVFRTLDEIKEIVDVAVKGEQSIRKYVIDEIIKTNSMKGV